MTDVIRSSYIRKHFPSFTASDCLATDGAECPVPPKSSPSPVEQETHPVPIYFGGPPLLMAHSGLIFSMIVRLHVAKKISDSPLLISRHATEAKRRSCDGRCNP
jgi:hypothetical protein